MLGQLVLAGAFAGWYWTFKKPDNLPSNGLSCSFYRAVRYHLGQFTEFRHHKLNKQISNIYAASARANIMM